MPESFNLFLIIVGSIALLLTVTIVLNYYLKKK